MSNEKTTETNNTNIMNPPYSPLCPDETGSVSATRSVYKALDHTRLVEDAPLEVQESGQGHESSTDKCRSQKCQAFRTEHSARRAMLLVKRPIRAH